MQAQRVDIEKMSVKAAMQRSEDFKKAKADEEKMKKLLKQMQERLKKGEGDAKAAATALK